MENKTIQQKSQTVRKSFFTKNTIFQVFVVLLGCLLGVVHYKYVTHLFENDRNFSYLSELEREMSLRTEMGFYYSYYKTIVQEKAFVVALTKLMYDKVVEYPKDVNAFNRFNIHPELMIGALYRYLEPWLNETFHHECHIINRGNDLPSVNSCVGLQEPIYFYLEVIWWLAGVTVAALFLFATTLSGTVFGGLLAVAQYFGNHSECTRVMWTPNERENFAQPFLLIQMWLVTTLIRRPVDKQGALGFQVAIFFTNGVCLLFWQFTQFIFLTQTAIFFVMEQLHIIDLKTFWILLHAQFCGIHMAVLLLQGNEMLKSSIYVSFFLILSVYSLFFSTLRIQVRSRVDLFVESWLVVLRITIIVCSSLWLKRAISQFLDVEDDSHIFDILYSKFSNFKTFHTLLYTCSPVFDFLPLKVFYKLSVTGLIPLVLFAVSNVLHYWFLNSNNTCDVDGEEKKVMAGGESKKSQKKKDKRQRADDQNTDDSGIENNAEVKRRRTKYFKTKDDWKCTSKDVDRKTEDDKRRRAASNNRSKVEEVPYDKWVLFLRNLEIDPGIFYNVSQMCVFAFMAFIIMRLKLLFTPHLCIISSLAVNSKYHSMLKKHKMYCFLALLAFLGMSSYNINKYIQIEMSHVGEFSDLPLEELLTWITEKTSVSAVFAGPMPLTATIMLTTRRAIVNHPHYEHSDARHRNYAMYKTYGKFSSLELYGELTKLKVTHLIVDRRYCYGWSGNGCSFEEVWDHEVPGLSDRPHLCHRLLTEDVEHFFLVYANDDYSVFKIHDYSVRYMPKLYDT